MLTRDISNYTDDNIEELLAKWYTEGDRLVIIQAFPSGHKNYPEQQRQIAAAVAQGMVWDAYIYDYLASPWWREQALDGLREDASYKPRMVWLDEEDVSSSALSLSIDQRRTSISTSVIVVQEKGYKVGIYTAPWWWNPYVDQALCSDLPLWVSQWDGISNTEAFTPFGGWTECAIKQFAGTQPDGTDLNVLSLETEAEVLALLNPTRETPDDWPWATWREAAINFKAIADAIGQQLASEQDAESKLDAIREIVKA